MIKGARTTNQRIVLLCATYLCLFGVLWVRCLYLQVFQSRPLARLAAAQHRISQTLIAPRGNILDRDGRLLATSVRAPSVFANPHQVSSREYLAGVVAPIVDRDAGLLKRRLGKDKGFVWLARHVDRKAAGRLAPLRRHGIGVVEESRRIYPNGPLASHLVGFTNIDQQGLEGLELALDGVVQGMAEDALSWGVKKFRAKGGTIVVMDPQTGAVLAIATSPSFDPNQPVRVPTASRRNRALTDLFEPGSVFKIVTAAALLEERLVRPDERVFCEQGSYKTIGRHILHDHHPHGWLTFHQVIALSSNIGTAKTAQRLPPETLYRYIRGFGFGQKTGLELPGEVSGIAAPPSRWSKLSHFIIPIGQEVAVTPIQLAVMTSVVANGGWKVKPYLVQRI